MSFLPRGRLSKSQSASRRTGRVTRKPLCGLPLRLEALEDRFLPSGTPHLLKDINTHLADATPAQFLKLNGVAFFSATDGTHGFQLWRSDGTARGTRMVTDINLGDGGLYPGDLTNRGGTLFFFAEDRIHGDQLWRSDGTAGGTQLVKDMDPGLYSPNPHGLTNVGGTLFFEAYDGTHGFELWRSDLSCGDRTGRPRAHRWSRTSARAATVRTPLT
jgi:ELWxxDGT repeat protein